MSKKENGSNWLEALQNPKGLAIKKFMFQVLGDKFPLHDDLISRISTCLITDGDLIAFNKLINDVYDVGFVKAVTEYKKIDERMSKVTIKRTLADSQ